MKRPLRKQHKLRLNGQKPIFLNRRWPFPGSVWLEYASTCQFFIKSWLFFAVLRALDGIILQTPASRPGLPRRA